MDSLAKRNKNTEWSAVLLALQGGIKNGIVPNIEATIQRLMDVQSLFAETGSFDLADPDPDAAALHAEFKAELDGWLGAVSTAVSVPAQAMSVLEIAGWLVAVLHQIDDATGNAIGLQGKECNEQDES